MDIVGIDQVALGVLDMDAAQKFWRDYGLVEVEAGAAGGTWHAKDGTGVIVRHAGDKGLPMAVAPDPNFRETIWGVSSKAELEKIGAELSKDRQVAWCPDGVLRTTDDDGYAIGFQLTQRKPFNSPPVLINVPGRPYQRLHNAVADYDSPITPSVMSHVVFSSLDMERAARFYVERLGFYITDRFTGTGLFMRCGGNPEHHTLFITQRPGRGLGLGHIAFHVRDQLEFMLAGTRFAKNGWKSHWGPGRHIFGSNHFWYFASPFGGTIEIDADMDICDENWVPRETMQTRETGRIYQTDFMG